MLKTDNHELPQLCTFNTAIIAYVFLDPNLPHVVHLSPFVITRPIYSMNCNWKKLSAFKVCVTDKGISRDERAFWANLCVDTKKPVLKLNLRSTYRTPWNRILSSFAKKTLGEFFVDASRRVISPKWHVEQKVSEPFFHFFSLFLWFLGLAIISIYRSNLSYESNKSLCYQLAWIEAKLAYLSCFFPHYSK